MSSYPSIFKLAMEVYIKRWFQNI